MSQIYDAELPYSDELAHHGIPGQKWGVRRFQNADGSLTAAGRERYSKSPHRLVGENGKGDKIVDARVRKSISKKASVIKSGNKKSGKDFVKGVASATLHGAARAATRLGEGVARGVKTKLAEKMPFMLNDEELERYRDRLKRENTFRSEIANRRDLKNKAQGDQFVKKLAQETIKTVANKATNKIVDNLLKSADDREREELDLELKRQSVDKGKREVSEARLRDRISNDVDKVNTMREEKDTNERQIARDRQEITRLQAERQIAINRKNNASTVEEQLKAERKIRHIERQSNKHTEDLVARISRNQELKSNIRRTEESINQRRRDLNDFVRDPQNQKGNSNS